MHLFELYEMEPFEKLSLETERLLLRMWDENDFEAYASMVAEPEVMQFLSAEGKPLFRPDAWRQLALIIGHWRLCGFGMFAVVEKSSGELVGRVGPWQPEGWPEFEIGWSLRTKFWERGYATEAARICMTYAFKELRRPHVVSLIDPRNIRSIQVAKRLGECLEGETSLPHLPATRKLLQYGVSCEDWMG